MIYGKDETPLAPGPEGIVKIFRECEDIHRPETIASANGKSVTYDHPSEDVDPTNWKKLTIGIMMNVRPGKDMQDDLLLGDLLITTQEAIMAVQQGLRREVSLGYEAGYIETGPGMGKQTDIIVNHIALVENGRCGPRCKIKDHKHQERNKMGKKSANKYAVAMTKALGLVKSATKDNENPGDVHLHIMNDDESGGSGGNAQSGISRFTDDDLQDHIDRNAAEHQEMFARIEALEKLVANLAGKEGGEGANDNSGKEGNSEDDVDPQLEDQMLDEVPEGLRENAAKANDSAYLSHSFRDTVANAEILVPGIRIPTFDQAMKPVKTFKQICGLRRKALDKAYADENKHRIIDDILGGRPLDTKHMTCDAIRTLFNAAVTVQRQRNNAVSGSVRTADKVGPQKLTLAELNRRNAERYKNQ